MWDEFEGIDSFRESFFGNRPRREAYYDVAQICLNGHVVNDSAKSNPKRNENYCRKCGAKTITACPNCNHEIRGYYHVPGVVSAGFEFPAPRFCSSCGKPYPWTETAIRVFKDLILKTKKLSSKEIEYLIENVENLFRDDVVAEITARKYTTILSKVKKEALNEIKELMIGFASEVGKRILFPTE